MILIIQHYIFFVRVLSDIIFYLTNNNLCLEYVFFHILYPSRVDIQYDLVKPNGFNTQFVITRFSLDRRGEIEIDHQ